MLDGLDLALFCARDISRVAIMSTRRILLLLVLLPLTLGTATFAVLKHAGSQDDGGVIHAPTAPHAASPVELPVAPASGSLAPAASGQSDSGVSTSPPSAQQPAAPPANSAERPETAVPAQNDSAEVYGPARFAAATQTADESVEPASYGTIRVAALPAGVGSAGNMSGVRRGGSQSPSRENGPLDHSGANSGGANNDGNDDADASSPSEESTPPSPVEPEQGDDSSNNDVDSPSGDDDAPSSGSPPLLTPPDPELYNPIPPGPSDGGPQPPTHVNVPEPATMGLLGLGLLGCGFFRRRR